MVTLFAQHFLFMFNKLRMELLDESSIALTPEVWSCLGEDNAGFAASNIFVVANNRGDAGLVEIIMVDDAWSKGYGARSGLGTIAIRDITISRVLGRSCANRVNCSLKWRTTIISRLSRTSLSRWWRRGGGAQTTKRPLTR